MKRDILLNALNLHVGGGVQVAASTISEILENCLTSSELTIAVSDEVANNLSTRCPKMEFESVRMNVRGIALFQLEFRRLVDRHGIVFTIFGPLYRWRIPGQNIVGFAQAWIAYPRNEVYDMLSWPVRLLLRLKFWIQAQFFKRADLLVVELDHVKSALIRELGISPERIHVVKNCVSSVFRDSSSWHALSMPHQDGVLRLGFLGRNYIHKNTKIFPDVVRHLYHRHDIRAKFYVTFTDEEWEACSPEFRQACINVGPINVQQCPSFYLGVDAVVFPSLLECFSATPLEAMAMRRPLFVSDRPFNQDICGEHAQYFDPHAPEEVAHLIAKLFIADEMNDRVLEAARNHALSFSTPVTRAKQYLALLGANIVSSE